MEVDFAPLSVVPAPQVLIAATPTDANNYVEQHILSKDIRLVGLDTESRVFSGKGPTRPVAIIQIATTTTVIIVQLFQIWLKYNLVPDRLQTLLSDRSIVKCGVSISGDAERLQVLYGLRLKGFVDLETLASARGIGAFSLGDLAKHYYGNSDPASEAHSEGKKKLVIHTNWEAEILPPEAIQYAATDALTSAKLFSAILEGKPPHPDVSANAIAVSGEDYTQKLKERAKEYYLEMQKRLGDNFPSTNDARLANMLANSCRDFALLPDKRATAEHIQNLLRKEGFFQLHASSKSTHNT